LSGKGVPLKAVVGGGGSELAVNTLSNVRFACVALCGRSVYTVLYRLMIQIGTPAFSISAAAGNATTFGSRSSSSSSSSSSISQPVRRFWGQQLPRTSTQGVAGLPAIHKRRPLSIQRSRDSGARSYDMACRAVASTKCMIGSVTTSFLKMWNHCVPPSPCICTPDDS